MVCVTLHALFLHLEMMHFHPSKGKVTLENMTLNNKQKIYIQIKETLIKFFHRNASRFYCY